MTKAKDGDDIKMLVAAYAERLSDYPADVVEYVLKKWPETNTFFPAWAELKTELDFWGADRIAAWERVKNDGR